MNPTPALSLTPSKHGRHGVIRGLTETPATGPFDGRFTRLFPHLAAARHAETDLLKLAGAMTADFEATPTPETEPDDEENTGIRAGYTYLGQFIDHDLTFDPVSSLQRENDPNALEDFRTPQFDLDNIYGRGPADQPYLYRDDGLHMLLGEPLTGAHIDPNARGVPRNRPSGTEPARALLGDPRNDENVIVSQLQAAMLRFHNRVVDFTGTKDFEQAQNIVRFHYQWVVLNDFLKTIVGEETWKAVLPNLAKRTTVRQDPPHLKVVKKGKWGGQIPVEFSVAAYRFGHSMIRPIYRLNASIPRLPIFTSDNGESLVGFRDFPHNWAIDWRLFFDLEAAPKPNLGPKRIQPAYKIDSSLVNPLGKLPASVASNPSSLAARNLLRGASMGLPSGQLVADALGFKPIPDAQLKVGKANKDDTPTNPLLTSLGAFKNNAPLWYYILAEAQQQFVDNDTPIHMGPTGGRIVAEVFAGLMLFDKHSFLNADPSFEPIKEFRSATGQFGMAELLKQAILA